MDANEEKRRLTNLELRALLGCSRGQITAWEKAGLPFTATRGKRGRPEHSYSKGGALAWIRANGSHSFAFKAGELLDNGKGASAKGDVGGGGARDGNGGKSALDKLEETFVESHARFVEWNRREKELLAAGHVREAAACAKARAEAGKAVGQMQAQLVAAAKEMGVLVVAPEVAGVYLKIFTAIRNNFLGVPDSAVPLLMPLLRDAEKGGEAREILQRLIEGVLETIAGTKIEE